MAPMAFVQPMPNTATRAERTVAGKTLRAKAPRTSHGEWASASDRPDPISLLEDSNRTRAPELVPIRYGRMPISPFTFLRGSAIVMASDLARTPISGIRVQICGDAHISNLGVFAIPDLFAQAIALFAEAYADQTERDHAALLTAIKEGRIKAEDDV